MFRETESLELKKSTSELKEAIVSISAILNKQGRGELYFGVKNDGKAVGQQVSGKTIRDVAHAISEGIEPKIYPEVEEVEIDGKDCLLVSFSGESQPYFAFGRAYMRVGDEDRQLSARELECMFLKKNKETLRWDNKTCKNAGYPDLSAAKLRSFLEKAGLAFDSVENSLKKLKLADDGKPLNAAVLLFAETPQTFFPNARLRCAVFAGNDTVNAIDMQDYEGDLLYLIEEAQKYILKNIHTGMRIEGLQRVDVPEIDREALREAVINAFCHRDYHNHDSVNAAVFSDRVEISSPGLLYGGLTIARLMTERVSERRNELIAEMLHRVHYVENWGQGIKKILSKEPTATFKEVGRHFITVFARKAAAKGLGEKLGEKLGENERKILELVTADNQVTNVELAGQLAISTTAVWKNLAKLKRKGILKRIGPSKGGHWKLVKKW